MHLTLTLKKRIQTVCLVVLVTSASSVDAAGLSEQKAILVTGASTGIGRNIAERLASEGYFVYAGARKSEDIEALSKIENIRGVALDVTIQSDIDMAVETVRAGGLGLHAVVNNAGVVIMGLLAETPESEVDFVFDVNVYGPYRIVKAFAPLIVESKGRVINISSMAGIFSPPAYGVYSMSKHAIESFSDSLSFEMGTVGVHVSVVEPGPFNTPGFATYCKRRKEQDPANSLFSELAKEIAEVCADNGDSPFPAPDAVADAVSHAISSDEPKERYLAITDRRHVEAMLRDLLSDMIEINNNGHDFGFSRDELVAMLDETVSASAPSSVK